MTCWRQRLNCTSSSLLSCHWYASAYQRKTGWRWTRDGDSLRHCSTLAAYCVVVGLTLARWRAGHCRPSQSVHENCRTATSWWYRAPPRLRLSKLACQTCYQFGDIDAPAVDVVVWLCELPATTNDSRFYRIVWPCVWWVRVDPLADAVHGSVTPHRSPHLDHQSTGAIWTVISRRGTCPDWYSWHHGMSTRLSELS